MRIGTTLFLCGFALLAAAPAGAAERAGDGATDSGGKTAAPGTDLDFDFFDKAPAPVVDTPKVDESAVRQRRFLLNLHQALGMALSFGTLGSVVTGQLSYLDKYGGDNSNRYRFIHQAFTYPTLGIALLTATAAFLAPVPFKKEGGFSRMTLHKIGMFTAFAGWAAQAGLGIYTATREGYVNQQSFAKAHLIVGYVTLAGMLLGESAVIF